MKPCAYVCASNVTSNFFDCLIATKTASEIYVYFRSGMITAGFGIIDELYQGILPLRYFAWRDIALNGLGGLLGLTIFWALTRK